MLPIVVAAPKVTKPVMVLSPLLFKIAPSPPTPVPLTVLIASAMVMSPWRAKVAPDVIEVAPAFVPNEPLFAAINVPAVIEVAPV